MNTGLSYSVALVLTWTAGFVDAVGFLSFAHIYTANMSGNSVAFGIGLGSYKWPEALLRLWPIIFYVAGLLFGRSLIEFGAYRKVRRIASVAFAFEAGLLALTMLVPDRQWPDIAFLALAMGIQNATLVRFSSLTVHSGFVTGALLKFAEQFVAFSTWLFRTIRRRVHAREIIARIPREKSFTSSLFLLFVWIAYIAGALFGTWRQGDTKIASLAIPVLIMVALIVLDLLRPLAQKEEKEQRALSG